MWIGNSYTPKLFAFYSEKLWWGGLYKLNTIQVPPSIWDGMVVEVGYSMISHGWRLFINEGTSIADDFCVTNHSLCTKLAGLFGLVEPMDAMDALTVIIKGGNGNVDRD